MAWRSHGTDNASLVANMKANSVMSSAVVEETMLRVDRGHYVSRNAYDDVPQRIGYNVTISAPHMHAYALEHLKDHLKPGNNALDVGCGSGYLTACMAHMVGESGKAVGIDHIEELVEMSEKNIRGDCADLLDSGRVTLVVGDGRAGHAALAPYHAIHVGAAAPTLPPALLEQLAPGGRMICPVGPAGGEQHLEQVDRGEDGTVERKRLMGVMYVPLTDRNTQLK